MVEILNDIRKWLLDESSITDLVSTRIWKYEARTISDVILGETGSRALVIDMLPGFNNNPMSSQQNGILEVNNYASNSISANKKTADDGLDRCWNMYYITDEVLNRVSREIKVLTDFMILGIFRNGEPLEQFDDQQKCPYIVVNYELEYLLL